MIDWDTDYKKIFSVIKNSTKSLSDSKNLKDLDTFEANQRNECVPISSAHTEFEVPLKDLETDKQKIKVKIGDTESKVILKKLGNSDLLKIRFHWENPQVLWTHDLKVSLFIKKEGGSYELLNKDPIFIDKLNKFKVLCKLDISKYQGDFEPKEEIKEKSKNLERKEDKSQCSQQERNLKFKLSVENIDYGLKRIKEIDFFEIFKHSLVKNLDKFSFK